MIGSKDAPRGSFALSSGIAVADRSVKSVFALQCPYKMLFTNFPDSVNYLLEIQDSNGLYRQFPAPLRA